MTKPTTKPTTKPRPYLFPLSYSLLGHLSLQLHEIAHYKMARLFGLETFFSFNRWQILSEANQFERLAVSIAGPSMTFFLALFGLVLVYRSTDVTSKRIGFMLATFNSLMALIPNFFSWTGDLTWIRVYTGAPEYAIRLSVVFSYLTVLLLAFRKTEKLSIVYVSTLIFLTILVIALNFIADQIVWGQKTGLLFQPLFGISAIVVLTNILAFIAFVYVMVVYRRVECHSAMPFRL